MAAPVEGALLSGIDFSTNAPLLVFIIRNNYIWLSSKHTVMPGNKIHQA